MLVCKLQCLGYSYTFHLIRFYCENYQEATCPACASNNVGRELDIWATHVLTYGPNITLEDCSFINCGTAIKAERGMIRGRNVLMRGNQVGIDAEHSCIDIEELTIE